MPPSQPRVAEVPVAPGFDPSTIQPLVAEMKTLRQVVRDSNAAIREASPRLKAIEEMLRAYGRNPDSIE